MLGSFTMANGRSNLIPSNARTPEERRKIAIEGGKAFGASRRKRKAMREELETLMALPVPEESVAAMIKEFGAAEDARIQTAILVRVCQLAITGDLDAAKFLRDTIGEKPVDSLNLKGDVQFSFERASDGVTVNDLMG